MSARIATALLLGLAAATPALGYAEFEVFVERTSGRFIDCAMCHVNPEGPEGIKSGQIRALTPEELTALNQARAAFQPGMGVDSPILNEFGDLILDRVGKRRFLQIRATDPGQLAPALGFETDLDADGVPDAREYLEGTNPIDDQHGDPWTLFRTNFGRYWFHIVMILLATIFGLYGLHRIIEWFQTGAEEQRARETVTTSTRPYLARGARKPR